MVSSCVVIGCTQRFSKDSNILFHRFPTKNPALCRKWLRAIQRNDLHEGNLKYARICSLHFNKDSYLVNASNKLKLKSEVIPKICLGSKITKHQQRMPKTSRMVTRNTPVEEEPGEKETHELKEKEHHSSEENSEAAENEDISDADEDATENDHSDSEPNGVHFEVKEFRSVVPAQFTTSSGAGGPCYILVWNPDNLSGTGMTGSPFTSLPPSEKPPLPMPSDMEGMENRIKELESQISHLADCNTRLNQQVELLSESNKDLKKKLKTLQQNKRRLLKRLSTMEGMVNDWKDDRKPFTFCSDDL